MNLSSNIASSDKRREQAFKIVHTEFDASNAVSERLYSIIASLSADRELVVVCIGTDRSTGDSLGPLVGTNLSKMSLGISVYGTLDEPIHAMNLQASIEQINERHHNPLILAIDACLGQLSSVGSIQVNLGPVKPGAGVNKELPSVGDLNITGIVNVGGFMEYFVLQNTRLSLVFAMADVIATAIHRTVSLYPQAVATSLAKQD